MRTTESRKSVQTATLLTAILVITACATTLPEQAKVGEEPLQEDEGIAFGSLVTAYYKSTGEQWTGGDVPTVDYTLYLGTAENIAAKQVVGYVFARSDKEIMGSTKNPRILFAKRLPAGEYSIYRIGISGPNQSGHLLTDIRFYVARRKATYIGSLQFDFHGERGLFGEQRLTNKVLRRVVDEFDTIRTMYAERNPSLTYEFSTSLMTIRK